MKLQGWIVILLAGVAVSCSQGGGSSQGPSHDPVIAFNQVTGLLNQSAQMPQAGDTRTVVYNHTSFAGTANCYYHAQSTEEVTTVTDSHVSISRTYSDVSLLPGQPANCPDQPTNLQLHKQMNIKAASFIKSKTLVLQQDLAAVQSLQAENWFQSYKNISVTSDSYPIGETSMPVYHVAVDIQAKNGGIFHVHYYISQSSWFMGQVGSSQCNNYETPRQFGGNIISAKLNRR